MAKLLPWTRSLLAGALVAPLSAPLAAAPLAALLDTYASLLDAIILFPVVAIVSVAFSYAALFFIGLPLVLILHRMSALEALSLCACASLAGGLLWFGLQATNSSIPGASLPLQFVFGAGVALMVTITFCAACGLAIRSNRGCDAIHPDPDR